MSDKTIFLNLFNQKADEFCKDLVSTFPEVNEFKQLKSGLLLLKNVDEKKPREFFNSYVGINFRTHILEKDESFFLNEVQNHVQGGLDNSQWQKVISLLRTLWTTLSADNKESIWKYFQVLIAINDKCN
jgi:hypothetical protein